MVFQILTMIKTKRIFGLNKIEIKIYQTYFYFKMNSLFIILTTYIVSLSGFNLNFRINSLQNIISTEAVMSSVTNRLNTELVTGNTLFDEVEKLQYKPSPEIAFYAIAMFASFYYQYLRASTLENKLHKFKMFTYIRNKTNMLLLIISLVFTKDVDSVL